MGSLTAFLCSFCIVMKFLHNSGLVQINCLALTTVPLWFYISLFPPACKFPLATGPHDIANSLYPILFLHHLSQRLWFLIYETSSSKFNRLTYLSATSQLNLGFLQYQSSIPLPLSFPLVLHCGWPESCFCVPGCHHDCCSCLHDHLIYYFLNVFRICHFSLYTM